MESCGCNRWPSLQGRSSQKRQRRMEPLWSPVVATGGNRWRIRSARNPPKQAKSVAVGCHRLPEKFHGKQGVCRGLPPVAGGPLPAKEGVELTRLVSGRLFLRAIRARTLVAAAASACLADHGEMILTGSSRGPSEA